MSKLDRALEDCLTMLASGQATVEDCLAAYPEHAGELRRLLKAASHLERGRAIQPPPRFKSRTRARLIAHANAHPPGRRVGQQSGFVLQSLRALVGGTLRLATTVAVVLVIFLTTGTVLAQAAHPGDPLYDWRVASENVFRALHPNPLSAILTLAERHAQDLIVVKDDPEAAPRARQDYQGWLKDLAEQALIDRQAIRASLLEQKEDLEEAQIEVPPVLNNLIAETISTPDGDEEATAEAPTRTSPTSDRTLETKLQLANRFVVQAGQLSYQLTLTNFGPASPVTATVTSHFGPTQTVVSADGSNCTPTEDGAVNCIVSNISTTTPHTLTLTPAVPQCLAGVVTGTTTISETHPASNTNLDVRVVTTYTITAPYPRPTRVIYVQSNGRSHNLVGTVTAGAAPLADNIHPRAGAPVWSPDGTRLAFFGEEGISELGGLYQQGNGVWVMGIVDGQPHEPHLLVGQDHVSSIAWSPDGTRLAFEFGPPGLPNHDISVVDARDGTLMSQFSGEQPAWSPDGQQLVIKACNPECGLWQVNVDGSEPEQLTFHETDSYPDWSPTGDYLAFTSAREGNWEIYLRHRDGRVERVTDRTGTDITPVFGPCGQEIYLRTDHFGGWRITVMKLDGSNEETIAEGVGDSDDWGLARPDVY